MNHTETSMDVLQVKVPLPFPLRWVNAYLVRGADGWTLIDPGLHTPAALSLWEETMSGNGLKWSDIERIVLTHHHPDHYGLAGWFQERCGAPVWMSEPGKWQAASLWGAGRTMTEEIAALFARQGLPHEMDEAMRGHMEEFVALVSPQPGEIRTIVPGETFRIGDRLCETIHTPGHAFGHICFYDRERREMFCGDHVLPQISPNVSFLPGIDDDPLASYLRSLEEVARYEVVRAYPGHREPFAAFAGRARELVAHHHERLALMEARLYEPMSAYTLCRAVFGDRLTLHQLRFALSETIAHVVYLRQQGRVSESERDGTLIYEA